MIGIDTNVLVRFVVRDDVAQAKKVEALMRTLSPTNPGFVALITLAEFAWILRSRYDAPRDKIYRTLEKVIDAEQLLFENPPVALEALHAFRKGNADLADYLIAAGNKAAGCSTTITFDRAAAKIRGMKLL